MKDLKLLDLPETLHRRRKSRAAHYRDQKQGLFPRGVKVGKRAVAWPAHEVDQIISAQLAGANDIELKKVVERIEASRKDIADQFFTKVGSSIADIYPPIDDYIGTTVPRDGIAIHTETPSGQIANASHSNVEAVVWERNHGGTK